MFPATLFVLSLLLAEPGGTWTHEELRRFPAAEANQGVAVDDRFFYAITNAAIGKYRKDTGERVGGWKGDKGGPITHLNAGLIRNGKLYCAHSNYPHLPATSSVEIFDPATLEHIDSHSFGIAPGSLTWIDRRGEQWFACFAHYSKDRPLTGRGPEFTEIVRFDDRWRREAGWVLPQPVLDVFGGSSSSGGAFGPEGKLFITGHDAPTLFVLEFPQMGGVLRLADTIPISAHGQAFAWDTTDGEVLFSISRATKEVIVSRVGKR